MQHLHFGRFEGLQILNGELILDPFPISMREYKFGLDRGDETAPRSAEFQLKRQVLELIQFVRSLHKGEIHCLEIRHGLPFAMEVRNDACRTEAGFV